jgi:hypothetical protein
LAHVPNYTSWINEAWGWPQELGDEWFSIAANASNVIIGGNPPYVINQFLAIYPKFFGIPLAFVGTTDGTTGTILVANTTGLSVGQLITGPGIANGSVITVITPNVSIVVGQNTTAAGSGVTLSCYSSMPIPLPVLTSYMYLATWSIQIGRWFGMWQTAVALYIAHFATLWIRSEAAVPNTTAAQIAQAGISVGIQISKSVQDVSVSYQALGDNDEFVAWQMTTYGQQLITFAKALGSGMMMCW